MENHHFYGKTMENHHFQWENYGNSPFLIGKLWKITMLSMGKSTISTGPFSIANCNSHYQRVNETFIKWRQMMECPLPCLIAVYDCDFQSCLGNCKFPIPGMHIPIILVIVFAQTSVSFLY